MSGRNTIVKRTNIVTDACCKAVRLLRDEEGQGIAEYGLIILLSSIAVVTALGMFGSNLSERFDEIVRVVAGL